MTFADRHQPLADIGAGRQPSRSPSRGFWWTKPQSVRISKRRAGSDSANNSAILPSRSRYPIRPASGRAAPKDS